MAKRLLLIGWDAADWKFLHPLIDSGQLPALNEVVEKGVTGDLLGCQPIDGAALWTSIVTGKRPWQHGIAHSREFEPDRQRLVAVSGIRRRTAAVWEMLSRSGLASVVVGWPATHGAPCVNGNIVSDRYSEPTAPPGVKPWPPAIPGTYFPENLRASLDALRVSPENIGADMLRQFVPNWTRIDQKRDRRLGQLRVLLSPDLSNYCAAEFLLRQTSWDFAAVRFPALGHIARLFLPFQSPRRNWISEGEFELYHDVVAAVCRMLGQSLASLTQIAGPDTAIVVLSAHGARSPDFPPTGFPAGETAWKSPYGIIAAAGPGMVEDRLLHGASVLDVAPTILNWFGLPIGDDMEGRVLVEAFAEMPEILRVPSWDAEQRTVPADDSSPAESNLVARNLQQETRWNRVQSLMEAGRFEAALPQLQELFRDMPERPEFSHALFQCQLNLGRLPDAEQTLEVLVESVPPGPLATLTQAELALAKRDLRSARTLVSEIGKTRSTNPSVLKRFGILLLRLREWTALEELARFAIGLDESDPIAWLGLAEATLRRQKPTEAEQAARRAIQLKYFLPDAHFVLARALVAQNKWNEARDVMSATMALQPGNKAAVEYHRRLGEK
jgi:hypothetical protein